MHQCGTDIKILVEGIIHIKSDECLALCAIHRLIFERHRDVCTRVDDALVGDSHRTHIIVDGIVGVFGECHPSGSDHH